VASYDYEGIPVGYYDRVLQSGNPVRRLWHLAKFERVLDYLPESGDSLLDVGCFAGTFLSLVPQARFARQVGVDVLRSQVDYASARYGSPFREFRYIESIESLDRLQGPFDCITLIEVLEHLDPAQVRQMLSQVSRLLGPGGRLVITTPNYASTWPLLEILLNRWSDVTYDEQHITKFTYFDVERKLAELYPPFVNEFAVELKTTSHSITPFLAAISFRVARFLSRLVPHRLWRFPFGNLVLLVASRRDTVARSLPARAAGTR